MPVALITGCSSGIGMHSALALARHGITTYASMRDTAKASELLAAAQADGTRLEVLQLDVRDQTSIDHAVRTVQERHGPVDVLVNNAGVSHAGPVETLALERAHEVMDTNFWGMVRTTRAVLPQMRERGSGTIVNVGSLVGRVPGVPYGGFYGASKHALSAISESLAFEAGQFGIRVTCVEPDQVPTEIFVKRRQEGVDPQDPYAADHQWAERHAHKSSTQSCVSPRDVADAVLQAALDPHSPLHVLVGESCKQVVALARQCHTFEEWSRTAAQIMESAAGPRPAHP